MSETMSETKYNGWTNYETWLVNLWLDNGGDCEHFSDRARELLEEKDFDRADATSALEDEIKEHVDTMQEETCGASGLFADLLNAALGSVDWREIAAHYVDDVDVWSVGWNMPGYMPDSDPAFFLDESDARECLADEMERHADGIADDDEGEAAAYRALMDAAEECRSGSGEYGRTVGAYHYFVSRV